MDNRPQPPLSRFDYCKQCRAALHACRQCVFYETTVAKQCREPIAEEVRDKGAANFCDYFTVRSDAFKPADTKALDQARAGLESLFGNKPKPAVEADQARAALDALFGKK